MMTNEEYQKNLIRLWDILRTEHKGEKGCVGVGCRDCPLYNEVGKCNVYKSIEIVENWAKQHLIVTNADKFKEMFGLDMAPISSCVSSKSCEDCEYYNGSACSVSNRFWNSEYNEKTKE